MAGRPLGPQRGATDPPRGPRAGRPRWRRRPQARVGGFVPQARRPVKNEGLQGYRASV